jgi:hypothetical protein
MKTFMKSLLKIIICLVAVGIIFLVYIYSGAYNIAASVPHSAVTEEFLELTVDRSIEHQAQSVSVPGNFGSIDPKGGFSHYDGMCIDCHGAPGVDRSEFGQGLYPGGPLLYKKSEDADEDALTPSELFWVVKHGIKMTGMPAFGKTHDDEKIWEIVAFLDTLPALSNQDYINLRRIAPSESDENGQHPD